MERTDNKNIVFIPILLMLSFLVLPMLDQEDEKEVRIAVSVTPKEQTGFLDYDLLPKILKKEMKQLQQQDTLESFRYFFAYFFENDDVNHRYYITDAQQKVVRALPVKNQEALELVDDKIREDQGSGYAARYDERIFSMYRQKKEINTKWYRGRIAYVLPEDKAHADFSNLKVGILHELPPDWAYNNQWDAVDNKTYLLSEVDKVPKPVRGLDYFKEVVMKEIRKNASFLYADLTGEVVVEFTIGSKAKSPQIKKGFSTRSETHEAYRADGAIIKAINHSKVHWIPGKRHGKLVNVRMAVTFSFDNKQNQQVLPSMSDLQDATEAW